jgi:hypothetical protein
MTILDVGRCLGSGKPPLEGSTQDEDRYSTGVCATCSGRFEVENGLIQQHEAAAPAEREAKQSERKV